MNIWIFLWILIAIFILGASSWSYLLLFRQKHAWKQLADKHKLTYTKGGMLEAARVRGIMHKNLTVTLYTEQQVSDDGRSQRFRNIVLIEAPWGIDGGGAVACAPQLRQFIVNLKLPASLDLDAKAWPAGAIFHTEDKDKLLVHLTPERIKMLSALLGMKNAEPMVLFDFKTFFIRLETADPLDDLTKLEKLLSKLFTISDGMKPTV